MPNYTDATEQALKHLQEAEPHIREALSVLCRGLGIPFTEEAIYEVNRNLDDERERDRAVVVLRNARSAHLYVTDPEGT